MSLSREAIVQGLKGLVPPSQVITDEQVLKDSSVDRFRKYENICGVYSQPIPAAVVYAHSTAEVAPRLTCRLGGGSLLSANSLAVEGGRIVCGKKVYSQHLDATFQMAKSPACISIARGGGESDFSPVQGPKVVEADYSHLRPDFILSSTVKKTEQSDDLSKARRLLVAGQGVGGPEALEPVRDLTQSLEGQWGVTRPVAMNAWAPLSKLAGVSGAMTRPGTVPHLWRIRRGGPLCRHRKKPIHNFHQSRPPSPHRAKIRCGGD